MNTKRISLSTNDKIGLVSNMSTMLTAGISILEIIDSLLEDAKGNTKTVLQVLKADINQGKRIHTSFEKFPMVFDKVTINIVRAAEEAGTLDTALKDLKINIKKEQEFIDKVRSAFIYPALILFVFLGVLLMILTFVVPKIATVFSRLRTELPLPTKILIFLSNVILQYTIPLIAGLVVLIVALVIAYRFNKRAVYGVVFSVPGVSGLIRYIDLTRLTRSLYLLLSAGIPIVSSLELVQDVVFKKEVHQMIVKSKEMVLSGKPLSDGLKASKKVVPSIMLKIIEAGEKSGSLDKSMQDVSEYLDYEVSGALSTITTLLEPVMLVVVGVLVGGMMLSIVAPIYGLIGQVGAR